MMLRGPFVVVTVVAGVVLAGTGAGCNNGGRGTYQGGEAKDAGPDDGGGIDVNGIGEACTYDPSTRENPTNTCPVGLNCLIVTSDGLVTAGLALDLWEDQTTVYRPDGIEEGYCTIIEQRPTPLVCPEGTFVKEFTGGTRACFRACSSDADCSRPGYVCDARYLDLGPTCVRACALDYPECIRTAVIDDPAAPGNPRTIVSFEDLQGASTCNVETGTCFTVNVHAGAPSGAPCFTAADCDDVSTCIQGPILGIEAGAPADAPGVCATACSPGAGADACRPGDVCQEAGDLALGFVPMVGFTPNPPPGGSLFEFGGFCFHQCSNGVPGNCDSVPETACGEWDAPNLTSAWNGTPMCLPDSLRR